MRKLDYQLNSLIRENFEYLFYGTIVILGLSVFLLSVIVALALTLKNHSGLEKGNIGKKAICLLLVCLQTFLSMPVFDVVVRTLASSMIASNVSATF